MLVSILPLAAAQDITTTSVLNGSVSDSTGAVLAGASVTLTGAGNGVTRTFKTDGSGSYSFRLVPPGTYTLKVEASGFNSYQQDGIALTAGNAATQAVKLGVGSGSDTVTVVSETPLMNLDNASLSNDLSARQVTELPLNLRNVFGLATLNSSVQNQNAGQRLNGGGTQGTADQDISFLNFGGGFFGTSAFMLDGIWDTASDWGGVVYVPSVDSVEEFKIQTNSFTSQYGFSTGNVINVTTKSGTNNFHGAAFEFARNSALDANFYFNNYNGIKKPDFSRNQFGASAGGPVYIPGVYKGKDKTFIFGLYEGLRQSTPAVINGTVPTTAFRSGNFASLLGGQIGTDALGRPILAGQIYDPYSARTITAGRVDPVSGRTALTTGTIRDPFAGNVVSATRFNAVGAKLASFYPAPTNGSNSNNFAAAASAPASADEYLIRVDHNISPSTRIFSRWAQKREFKTNVPNFYGDNNPAGPGNIRPNNRFSFVLGGSHVFSPTFLMSATAGLSRWAEGGLDQGYPFDNTSVGLPATLNTYSTNFPIVNVSSQLSLGPLNGSQGTGYRNVGSASVDFTKTEGRHNLSFGYFSAVLQNNGNSIPTTSFNVDTGLTAGPDPSAGTAQTGYGFASLLLGAAANGSTSNNFNAAVTKHYNGVYTEDDWKVTPAVTLNLGLRYEWQGAPTERHDRQAFFDYNAINPISTSVGMQLPGEVVFNGNGQRRGLYNTSYTNFAPRFGFSAQVSPVLVVRGGYGIFFSPSYFGGGNNPGFNQSTNYSGTVNNGLTVTSLSNAFPSGLLQPVGTSRGALQDVGQSSGGVSSNHRSPYVQNYSLGIQLAATPNDVITATYVGNRGTRLLLSSYNHSQLNPSFYSLGSALNDQVANPFYGKITSSGCGLDQPTIARGHLLSPYPQFCSVSEPQAPVGFSNYNAAQLDYNHRFHKGLNVLVSYTFSKFLDNVSGTNNWAYTGDQGPQNYYDLHSEKSVDGGDTPHSLVVNYTYELPIGRNRAVGGNLNRKVDAVVGGWQVSGVSSFKSGFPLSINGGGGANLYGANVRPDIVADVHIQNRNIDHWFNPLAFQQVPSNAYRFGNSPRYISQLRAPGFQNWDIAAQKYFNFTDTVRLQIRSEFFNAFNHTNLYAPDVYLNNRTLTTGTGGGTVVGGSFGTIRQSFAPRDLQFAAKLYW